MTTAPTADARAHGRRPRPRPTPAPTADARVLGLAHYAAGAVLEHVLAGHGITFREQIALRAAAADAPQTLEDVVTEARVSIKADPADIRATLEQLLARQLLVTGGKHLCLTDEGHELLAAVAAEVAPLSARIWEAIPDEDLAAAGRVLALVTERANAEHAAPTAPI